MFDRPSYHITANVTVTTGTLSATNLPMELTTTDTDQWNLVVMTVGSIEISSCVNARFVCFSRGGVVAVGVLDGNVDASGTTIQPKSASTTGPLKITAPSSISTTKTLSITSITFDFYVNAAPPPSQERRACRFILNRNKCTCRHILIVTALFTVPTNHLIVTQATLSSPMSESDKLTTPFTVMSSGTATQTKVILDESVLTACFAHSMLMQTGGSLPLNTCTFSSITTSDEGAAVQANLLTGETLSLTGVTFTSYSSLGNGGALLVLSSALTTLKPATLPTSKAATHTHPNGAKHANCGLLQLPCQTITHTLLSPNSKNSFTLDVALTMAHAPSITSNVILWS
ncbi:hypothetical protein BLNAU_10818 [Blattamonas nauphoetae]|uniref:Uncharacterized protein n=1 Tax=Blattamonas nauphoetae TaxID=2049346 RepID=A0ABQ9XR85_9EUKA|nr:hypothetical protein BLNAU_10818 [Blattamonas nauphoetae]